MREEGGSGRSEGGGRVREEWRALASFSHSQFAQGKAWARGYLRCSCTKEKSQLFYIYQIPQDEFLHAILQRILMFINSSCLVWRQLDSQSRES